MVIHYSVHFHSFKGLHGQGSDPSPDWWVQPVRVGLSIRVFVIRSRSELGQGVIKKFGLGCGPTLISCFLIKSTQSRNLVLMAKSISLKYFRFLFYFLF